MLWTHFLRKLGYAAGAQTGLPWLIAALCAPAPPPSQHGGASGASVSMDGFRAAVQSLAVPASHREVEAIMGSCETTGRADAVSLDLLVEHAAATLTPARRAAVTEVYEAVARGGSPVGVAELAGRFRPEATAQVRRRDSSFRSAGEYEVVFSVSLQVRIGGAPPKDVLEAFLGFFIELGCDRDVSLEAFAAFHAGPSAATDSDSAFLLALRDEWGWQQR